MPLSLVVEWFSRFIKQKGWEIGTSLLEEDRIELAKELLAEAEEKNVALYLPVD